MKNELTILAVIVWIAFSFLFLAVGSLKISGKEVRNPLMKLLVGVIFFPFLGAVLTILGWIGSFMLLPFTNVG